MNQTSNLLNSSRRFLPPIKHCILSWLSSVSPEGDWEAALDRCGPLSALWVTVPLVSLLLSGPLSCTALPPPSPPVGFQTGSPHPILLDVKTHFSGRCVLYSVSQQASQSQSKVRCKNPDQREGLDMCPGQQCGLSFPCLWTLPAPRPWHLNSLLDVRAVELSEHVHIEAGVG